MKRKSFVLVLILSMLLNSCAGKKTKDERLREGDNSGQSTTMTVEDEKRMTAKYMPEMEKQYPKHKSVELQAYVEKIGRKLVTLNKLEGNPYHYTFTAVDVNYVNAFALPAGTIFVTAPLIKMTENESELAGVIGHEIGHVKARHTAERIDAEEKGQTKNILTNIGGGLLGGALGYALGNKLCKKGDTACIAKAAVAGAAVGVGGTLLVQKYAFFANSREDEMEADRIGFRVATGAGYSKDHVGKFYEKLFNMEKASKGSSSGIEKSLADAMSTHPPSEERVKQMNDMSLQLPANSSAIIETQEHAGIKKKI